MSPHRRSDQSIAREGGDGGILNDEGLPLMNNPPNACPVFNRRGNSPTSRWRQETTTPSSTAQISPAK